MIALVDMNAFFASIEQLDHPEWRGRAVGVTNGERGTCLITCSYEARRYGIKTGTRIRQARRMCPDLIQAPARPQRYAAVSRAIMHALEDFTPDVEVFSVDEAFLDLTRCQGIFGTDAAAIGRQIKARVLETFGLLCSVGISGDRSTAKWAAKQHKPDGLKVIEPWHAAAALEKVPVTALCGINQGIGDFLARRGVKVCGDMKRIPIGALSQRFGNPGRRIWLMAQGRDPEPVRRETSDPKTIGHGKVIPPDTRSIEVLATFYMHMAEKVSRRLRKNEFQAGLFGIGLRTALGWEGVKCRTRLPTDDGRVIFELCTAFLENRWSGEGVFQVQVTALDPHWKACQRDLFDRPDPCRDQINRVVDQINVRYGEWAIFRAPLVHLTDMPNVIAPAWKPYGHREFIDY